MRAIVLPSATALLLLGGLYWATFHFDERRQYLLFHSLAEGFSIVVACCIFVVAWNARPFLGNHYLLFIGITYLFVAAVDGAHTLAYYGMNIFKNRDANLPTQLWVCARFIESGSLLLAPLFIRRQLRPYLTLASYAALTAAALTLVFGGSFPDCYRAGLTHFKIAAEYSVCAILACAAALLLVNRHRFDPRVLRLLIGSMLVAIASELCFTLYSGPYAFFNFAGHYLKIISFYLVYKAIVQTGISQPYSLLLADLKRSEESLRESEQRYRSLVELSPEMVAVHDGETYLYINRAGAALFGAAEPQQVVGRRVLDLVHPADRDAIAARIRNTMAGASSAAPREIRVLRLDGRMVEVESAATAITYKGRRAIQVILRDITRRKIQERIQQFLADAGTVLAGSLDYQTTLASVAKLTVPRFADCCVIDTLEDDCLLHRLAAHGEGDRQPLMKSLQEKHSPIPPSEVPIVQRALEEARPLLICPMNEDDLAAAASCPEDLAILRAVRPTSAMLAPLSARGRKLGVISFLLCDTWRHYTRDDVIAAEEVSRRAALAIDNARLHEEAQRANAAKDHFMAVLSHELRTPLTPVLMSAELLQGDATLPQSARDEIGAIRRNVALEARLIDDLLDVTRIAHGKLELHPRVLDVHENLRSTVQICNSDIAAKGVRLCTQWEASDARVNGDAERLHQVFWNLVKNAVKFTPRGGQIDVRTSNPRPGIVRVRVIDSGIGIAPELLPRLFGAFEQGGRNITRQFGGLGLGLAICRALVEMHHGTISACSDGPGHGAIFTVDLPTAPAADQLPAKPQAPLTTRAQPAEDAARSLRILLVEDHAATAHVLARLLAGLRHEVATAGSIASAKELASQRSFDIVISDLGLPDGSGLELMRYLKSQYNLRGVALSGYGMEEDIRRSAEAGFAAHLVKPTSFSELKDAIDRVAAAR